ncbi:MAG: CNNM domain-containing protein [Nanoarchaeota archaeon]|jgi:putative hemolysin|nr:CNNM domain-containing protein [Nanoarchaeota archaeon]
MDLTTSIIILFVLVVFSALFSGMETALMAVSRVKVNSLVDQKKKGALALQRIKDRLDRLIITILIGNNLVNIGAASFATVVFMNLFESSGIGIATGVMTFMILVFGEIVPKTFAAQNAAIVSLRVSRPIEILMKVLSPIIWFFELITKLVNKLSGNNPHAKLSEDDLKSFLMLGRKEGVLDKEEAEMMHNILDFKDIKVDDVMTHEDEVEMIDGNDKLSDVIPFIVKSPFSRYPVYLRERDNVIGIIDVDDVLKAIHEKNTKKKVKAIAKDVLFVPEPKDVDDLLSELDKRNEKVALVVNEYEDVIGLVSIEDILEEIVGDVFDKSRRRSSYLKKINNKFFKTKAKIPLEELNKMLDLNLGSKIANTLGGFIQEKLERIPKVGEKIKVKRVTFEVEKVNKKGIETVKIIKN